MSLALALTLIGVALIVGAALGALLAGMSGAASYDDTASLTLARLERQHRRRGASSQHHSAVVNGREYARQQHEALR